jgi:hypothetical protein
MEQKHPTIEECVNIVREINKDVPNVNEEELKHRANWLYILNRLNFFDDVPVLLQIINKEVERKTKKS